MANTVRDNNKGFCKSINSKRRSRDKIFPLVGENDHLRNIDMDKAEIFNVFFISVFNTDNRTWDPQSLELEDCDCRKDKLPANSEFVWDLVFQLDAYKFMGLIPGC